MHVHNISLKSMKCRHVYSIQILPLSFICCDFFVYYWLPMPTQQDEPGPPGIRIKCQVTPEAIMKMVCWTTCNGRGGWQPHLYASLSDTAQSLILFNRNSDDLICPFVIRFPLSYLCWPHDGTLQGRGASWVQHPQSAITWTTWEVLLYIHGSLLTALMYGRQVDLEGQCTDSYTCRLQ